SGTITWCNRAAEGMFDAPYTKIVATEIHAWLPSFEVVQSGSRASALESTAWRSDSTTFHVEIARTELALEGTTMTILIVRDVTARRHGQEALALARDQAVRAARSKADFLATMSHEIR